MTDRRDTAPIPIPAPTAPSPTRTQEEAADLMQRARKGDASCLPALRALLNDPGAEPLVRAFGSPPDWLRHALVESVAGEDLVVREASLIRLDEVRRALEGPSPSPSEALLAERAALCWWLVHRYEADHATAKGLTLAQSNHQQNRIDRAHGRLLSALNALARIRKMALPALQVNIATNQVNTIATAAP